MLKLDKNTQMGGEGGGGQYILCQGVGRMKENVSRWLSLILNTMS